MPERQQFWSVLKIYQSAEKAAGLENFDKTKERRARAQGGSSPSL